MLAAARIAGIMAAKRTHELIPLCHPLAITKATVEFAPSRDPAGIRVTAEVKVSGQTGVEMEALTAVSVACLTIYDMLKAADKAMTIGRHPPHRKDRRPLRHLSGRGPTGSADAMAAPSPSMKPWRASSKASHRRRPSPSPSRRRTGARWPSRWPRC